MTIDSPEKFSSVNARFNKLFSDIGKVPCDKAIVSKPFRPQNQRACSPLCNLHINLDTTSKNLIKHGEMLSLVIISFILMVRMFDQVVILLGEVSRCLSLLG